MDGKDSWRFPYHSYSDDELLRFAKGDMVVPVERHQQQQVLVAHDNAQPACLVATTIVDAQPIICDRQMMADLPSAMQLEHHQVPPMVHVQQPQPAPAMAFESQQAPFMVHSQYPQPAPAMPLQHQQMPGESPATVRLHDGQDQHMMSESSSAMPLHHQQMLVDSPATMQPQHQQMQGLSEPSPEVMSTLEYQQIMADLGLTDLYVEDEEVHIPSGGDASIPDMEPPVVAHGLEGDQIPKPSQEGGEGQFFAPASQPGDDLGPSGAASNPDSEPPVTPPAVAPAQPEQESCQHCYVVREVRNHSGKQLLKEFI